MDAQKLLDLWDAMEERRNASIVAATAESEDARNQAQTALAQLDGVVTNLQGVLWNAYPQPFVRCRDIGHVWDVKTETITESGTMSRELQCYRCTSRRHDEVDRGGEVISRIYHHADDYLMPKGSQGGRYGKPFWRGLTYMVVARTTTG